MASASKNGKKTLALRPSVNGAVLSDRMGGRELASLRRKIARLDVTTGAQFTEQLQLQISTLSDFRARWLFDTQSPREVMRKCRELIDKRTNDFCDFVVRMKMQFFNAGFEIWTPTKKEQTTRFVDNAGNYPFADLARDTWKEYLTCSNVVAFWMAREKARSEQLIDGMPRVMILNGNDVEFHNDFGIESVKIHLQTRKLTPAERTALGSRYTEAIELGKALELNRADGDNWKVLSTAKVGNGFGMPRWRAVFDDLAARDLLKMGDWNGAWARKHLVRHGKKGHKVTDGPLAGMPEYFYNQKFGKALTKTLQSASGFMELVTNFDLLLEYVYLNPDFFDPKVYKGIEDRLVKWAGAGMLMLREGNPNPNLSKVFQAEGLAEREVIGRFLEGILNDPTFQPKSSPRGMEPLQVRWDEWIFFNQDELRQMITFGIQNGIMAPQAVQRALRIDTDEHEALMTDGLKKRELFTPVFEAKQGMAAGEAGLKTGSTGNNGGDAGAAGGRPANQ